MSHHPHMGRMALLEGATPLVWYLWRCCHRSTCLHMMVHFCYKISSEVSQLIMADNWKALSWTRKNMLVHETWAAVTMSGGASRIVRRWCPPRHFCEGRNQFKYW